MKFKVRPRAAITGLIIVLGLGLVIKFVFYPPKYVPAEFSESRIKGAAIAQSIVTLSGSALDSFGEIADYDKNGNSAEALILISKQLIDNRQNQEAAVKLSSALEKMARELPNIKPAKARQVATAAVGAEVALVSRLVSYNDYLKQLFEVLRLKFIHGSTYSDGQVELLISKINEEAAAINDLNKRFSESLVEFDKMIL